MRLSGPHVGELIAELAPLVEGGRVREAQAVPPRDLLLVVEEPGAGPDGRIRRLRVASAPDAPRVHLQVGRVRKHDGPLGPFFRLAAAALEGARLARVEQVGADRIVRLWFEDGPDVSELRLAAGARRALLAELTGRHANLLLVDAEERVRAVLVEPKPGSKAAERLAVGERWSAPPGRPDPKDEGEARRLADVLPDPPPVGSGSAGVAEAAPLSWRVEASLGALAEDAWTDGLRKDLVQRLERRLRNARNDVRGLEERQRQGDRAEDERRAGELLKAAQGRFRRGDASIELEDFFAEPVDGRLPLRRLELDPKLTPNENVARCFARAKKLERQAAKLPQELGLAEERVRGLEALLARASDEDPDELEAEAVAGGWLKPRQAKAPKERRKPTAPRLPYLVFHGKGGAEIRVGRNARDNDTLTFREARGNDLWLHTADCPGSHVVLRVDQGAEPHPEDLLDAAHLAIHFSPVRGTNSSSVHVARVKEVKKPRKAPAGLVTLSGGKVRRIRVEPERLERLLDTRGAGPGRPA